MSSHVGRIASILDKAGMAVDAAELGLGRMPIEFQQRELERRNDAALKAIEDAGKYGDLRIGYDSQEVRDAFSKRLSDRDIDVRQLAFLKNEGVRNQEAILAKAVAAYREDPTSEAAARSAGAAVAEMGKLLDKADALEIKLDDVRRAWLEFGEQARGAIESSLGQALGDIVTQTGDVRDSFRSLVDSIFRMWADLQARLLLQALVGDLGQKQSNGTYGTGSGSLIGAAIGGRLGLGGSATAGTTTATPVKAYAMGGIARRPHIGLLGEAGEEALIPMKSGRVPLELKGGSLWASLPHGRRIPASITGLPAYADGGVVGGPTTYTGTGIGAAMSADLPLAGAAGAVDAVGQQGNQNISLFVVQSVEELWARGYNKNRDLVLNTITGDLKRGGRVAKQVKRTHRS